MGFKFRRFRKVPFVNVKIPNYRKIQLLFIPQIKEAVSFYFLFKTSKQFNKFEKKQSIET